MVTIRLAIGDLIILGNVCYEFSRRLPDGRFQAENVETGERLTMNDDELAIKITNGNACIKYAGMVEKTTTENSHVSNFNALPKNKQDAALRCVKYLKLLKKLGITKFERAKIEAALTKIAHEQFGPNESPPSYATVCRWRNNAGEGLDVTRVADKDFLKGVNKYGCSDKRNIDVDVFEIIERNIYKHYMNSNRNSIVFVHSMVRDEIAENNKLRSTGDKLKVPCYDTVKNQIESIDEYERIESRFGKAAAEAKFAEVNLGPRPTRALQLLEVDFTKIDLMVIDERTFLPLGRPWLVIIICRATRMVVGMHISFDPPSVQTFAQCFKNSVLHKGYVKNLLPGPAIKERFPVIHNTWDCLGIGEMYSFDRELMATGNSLSEISVSLGFNYQILPRKKPWYKGVIERFFRTLNTMLLHSIPGTTFSNFLDKADYDPEKNAIITYSDLLYIAHKWIIDIYSQKIHRGLQKVPAHYWAENVAENPVRMVENLDQLDANIGNVVYRVLTRKGIEFENLHYCSHEVVLWLRDPEFIRRSEATKGGYIVKVSYDLTNIANLRVFDPRVGRYVRVPCFEHDYANGLSIWQHNLICRHVREKLRCEVNLEALDRARAEISEMIENIMNVRKKGRKIYTTQRGARYKGVGRNAPSGDEIPDTSSSMDTAPTQQKTVKRSVTSSSLSKSKVMNKVEDRISVNKDLFKALPSDSIDVYDDD